MVNIIIADLMMMMKKNQDLAKKKVLFQKDNAKVRMWVVTTSKFDEMGYELYAIFSGFTPQ